MLMVGRLARSWKGSFAYTEGYPGRLSEKGAEEFRW